MDRIQTQSPLPSFGQSHVTADEFKRAYHRHLGQLTSAAMARKASEGGCPGCAPTGYRNVAVGNQTEVEIDPVLGPLVQEAFRLAGRKRTSLRKILAELTPQGLVSRNGKAMHASVLRGILTNPFYVGMIRYQGRLYEGDHQPLVSPSMFDRAGRNLRRRRR
jgi:site-specific DNA recombinase